VSEPPEPRRPAEGGGDEDYDAIWENAGADEVLDGLGDDALLDSIAQGLRGELGPDELTELLSGLRDVPDAVDLHVPYTAAAERGENVLPPRTTERAESVIAEDAARLRQLASPGAESAALTQATQELESCLRALQSAVEQIVSDTNTAVGLTGGDEAGQIQSTGEHAGGAIEDTMGIVSNALDALTQAGEHCQAFRGALGDVAGRHGA